MGLKAKTIPITTDFEIIDAKCRPGIAQKSQIHEYLQTVLTNVKESEKELQNMTFLDYIKTKISKEQAQYLLDFFGYTSELTVMNANDAIKVMRTYFTKNTNYYILKGGLSQVVEKLHNKIKRRTVVETKTEITDVTFNNDGIFEITSKNRKKEYCKVCIFAVTKDVLEQISFFEPIYKYLKYIELKPLCRIYAKYATPWYDFPKITTNNPLNYIIPIDPENGIIMISYTDEEQAQYWKRVHDRGGIPALKSRIQTYIKQVFHIDTPQPRALKMCYWDKGVAYYTKGFESTTMTKAIRQPRKQIPLYVCGENYSLNNTAWIEGGLDTSALVVKEIQKVM